MPRQERLLPEDDHNILRITARAGSVSAAARELGVAPQTLKNWLSTYYHVHDYTGLPQALYHEFIETWNDH